MSKMKLMRKVSAASMILKPLSSICGRKCCWETAELRELGHMKMTTDIQL
ncbi:hypothetical protein Plhal304r1_c086g0169511 [Plasmopara halstedii]